MLVRTFQQHAYFDSRFYLHDYRYVCNFVEELRGFLGREGGELAAMWPHQAVVRGPAGGDALSHLDLESGHRWSQVVI